MRCLLDEAAHALGHREGSLEVRLRQKTQRSSPKRAVMSYSRVAFRRAGDGGENPVAGAEAVQVE
ncbi:MAG TPA: hypothetical protein VK915_10805 [Gaiellaceae bacterium]|nr:hypothetical protein [Gaiellaceae bacterium]